MTIEEIQIEADKRYPPLRNHITTEEEVQDALNDGFVEGAEWAKPQWISVEDRLPEFYEDVLIFVSGKVDFGYIDEEDIWNTRYVPRIQVTHWMPLPEPPK